ncbi:DUF2264 domain-containing protein [Nocardiopsis sp. MG754419]|uniref:DUF2264 domain-containing protein n=1 Tax=Nocardiopsis sp. MG754419 TaxID=2259865 RepID=UPI001BADD008|nr:DUF2264 domain-containing protein [Nocardiopsis sp. MG754419]MBR8742952.1 hypothetical protein [Nocardiopsis sp. MG754419]
MSAPIPGLPPDDRDLSPHTGWTRAHWVAVATHLLRSVRPHTSPGHARIELPGPHSSYGPDSDALEGYARTFLLAAFLVAGERGHDPHGFLDRYRAGLVAGTDPTGPEAWPRPDRVAQAKVEAASIALGLMLTRPWLWDRMRPEEQARVVDWLATVVGESYPPINWVWFQIIVEEFLRSVGGPWEPADLASGLAVHASLRREQGWLSDGSERSYDHYCGWALHFYPLVWAHLAQEGPDPALVERWRADLRRYLHDHVHHIGADGAPLFQGRSLTYRMASAAPLWVGAWTGATELDPGLARRAASGVLRHFVHHGAPDADGLLTLGWHGAWPRMRQSYSGAGSPYWAAKGFFGLLMPEEHPVWSAPERPLPVERGDFRRTVVSPGWIVSGTVDDGVVRVVNHGTDHGTEGEPATDAPLYARLGYSTSTSPVLVGEGVDSPLDHSVVVLDDRGRATHRTGFTSLGVDDDGVAAVGRSRWRSHWVEPDDDHGRDHGSGRRGDVRPGPMVEVWSLVRGADEVRVVRVGRDTGPADRADHDVRVGGWPVPLGSASTSLVRVLSAAGPVETGSAHLEDVTPLAAVTLVPWVRTRLASGGVLVCLVRLADRAGETALPTAWTTDTRAGVTWPDGNVSSIDL